MIVFFFFQAEDGIRDTSVTGVQTCALPICRARLPRRRDRSMADMRTIATAWESRATETNNYTAAAAGHALGGAEIGRASCRERVWVPERGRCVEVKEAEGDGGVEDVTMTDV